MMDQRSQEMAGLFGQMMRNRRRPGRGQLSGASGLFDQYMQSSMMPRYQPPSAAGMFGMGPGGYGFMAPQMPALRAPPQQAVPVQQPGYYPGDLIGGP